VDKARHIQGMRVIIVHIPCLDGWGLEDNMGVTSARLAVESGIFPLYEVESGTRYTLNWDTKPRRVEEYLTMQKRYRHLSAGEIAAIQAAVDADWARLLARVAASGTTP